MKINRLLKIFVLIIMSIFTTACNDAYKTPVAKEVYLPLSKDSDGCMRYRLKSITSMSVQVILYKTADGGYTPNKENSICH
jgi:hypothetical protein